MKPEEEFDPTHNPWVTLDSREIYRNPWITVREDQVLRPDGRPGIYGVVETRVATGVVALTPGHEIYLVGQYRYPMDQYSWEIIEGGTDTNDEPPIEAAKRELQEEAGLTADHWEPLGQELHLSNCHSSERGHLFLASGLTQVPASPEGTEELQLKKVPLAEAVAMVERGEINDAMSIMAILLAERRLGGRLSPAAG
jgi:8-oxo-dGTP pyrophosphatase MutT (NUDIX family)